MKIIAKISGIYIPDVRNDLAEALFTIYSEGRHALEGSDRGYYAFDLSLDDPRTQRTLNTLEHYGFQPSNPAIRNNGSRLFSLRLLREYDAKDFEQAELLRPKPVIYYDSGRTLDGCVTLTANPGLDDNEVAYPGGIQPKEDIASAQFSIIVSNRLRRRLEQTSMTHIAFAEVKIDDLENSSLPDPLWQLTSDLILPPLSPRNFLTDYQGKPLATGEQGIGGVFVREGKNVPDALYEPAELHYARADLEAVGAFDLALASEWSGSGYLLASPRFYRFCVEEGLKMNWQPVRVDS